MFNANTSIEAMKRSAYLLILPWILLRSLVTFFIRLHDGHFGFELYISQFHNPIFSLRRYNI